ncbi:MAG: VWA domain-containing protein, partial [Flavobacteriaceae bacterium]|nr:VWA domain-containing protein [Flavobacteriaceae bacterium]
MSLLTIIFIILASVIAVLLVYFQYFYKIKYRKTVLILAFLRFLTIFTLLLLLINPKIQNKYFETIKPKLLVAIDNSSSITYSKQDSIVKNLVEKIERKKEIVKKFDVEYFTFGTVLKNNTNYSFQDSHTNISQALNGLNSLSNQQIAPIILISDGNQTFGRDYKYYQSKQAVYPVIVGDTTQLSDLEITQINANSYSYLHNNFPVEVFVRYTG